MDMETLQRFCDPEATRYDFSTPWVQDGYVYAASHWAAVRMPATPGMSDYIRHIPKIAEKFTWSYCEDCDQAWPQEDGLHYDLDESCHCLEPCNCGLSCGCDKCPDGFRYKPDCPDCSGTGEWHQVLLAPQLVGGRYIAGHLFRTIASSGKVLFSSSQRSSRNPQWHQPLSFTIDGQAEGLVAPFRRKSSEDIRARAYPVEGE